MIEKINSYNKTQYSKDQIAPIKKKAPTQAEKTLESGKVEKAEKSEKSDYEELMDVFSPKLLDVKPIYNKYNTVEYVTVVDKKKQKRFYTRYHLKHF